MPSLCHWLWQPGCLPGEPDRNRMTALYGDAKVAMEPPKLQKKVRFFLAVPRWVVVDSVTCLVRRTPPGACSYPWGPKSESHPFIQRDTG